MPGTLFSSDTMLFREEAGSAEAGQGGAKRSYELSTSITNGAPLVRSETTGKWFSLAWSDIIDMAVAAGIDDPLLPPFPREEVKKQ